MTGRQESEREVRRREVRITEDQFDLLWEHFPNDPELVALVCRDALFTIDVPNQTGRWPKYDARVYYDDGFHGSGYLLVHWNDAGKVPGCLSNGYCTDPDLRSEDIEWDDQPERERLLSIKQTLWDWAY